MTGIATSTATTGNVQLFAAKASHKWDVSQLTIYNSSGTPTGVIIKSGTATIYGPIPAPALGGAVLAFPKDPLPGAAGEAINIASVDALTSIVVSGTARAVYTV